MSSYPYLEADVPPPGSVVLPPGSVIPFPFNPPIATPPAGGSTPASFNPYPVMPPGWFPNTHFILPEQLKQEQQQKNMFIAFTTLMGVFLILFIVFAALFGSVNT